MEDDALAHLEHTLRATHNLIKTDWINTEPRYYGRALFTQIMIDMDEATKILRLHGERLTFNDDLDDGDITDRINTLRNAACHLGSPLRRVRGAQLDFNVMIGAGNLGRFNDTLLSNPFRDDVAVFIGPWRLLVRRQLHRAFRAAWEVVEHQFDARGRRLQPLG